MTMTEERPTAPPRDPRTLSRFEAMTLADPHWTATLTPEQATAIRYDWSWHRRPSQMRPPGLGNNLRLWQIKAGRGFGKTRVGAETTREQCEVVERIALVAPTAADIRDVMIEGESGLMSVFPPGQKPEYISSARRVNFYNGSFALCYSAEEPERLRGPQHEWAWVEEPASMRYGDDAVSNLLLGLRLGQHPWLLFTGTPKPLPWLRKLAALASTYVTSGSTYENMGNLAPSFIEDIIDRYEGTRLGRQELHGEFLDDVEGAFWTPAVLEWTRLHGLGEDPDATIKEWCFRNAKPLPLGARRQWRTIVAVDPPGTTAECGIIAATAPRNGQGGKDHAVITEDASMTGRPEEWGAQVVAVYRRTRAEAVWVEQNQGGDMCRATIHNVDPNVTVKTINAKLSKSGRAEPVSTATERGYVHLDGYFPQLEDQLTSWVPGPRSKSPDRLDAFVHAVRVLLPDITRKPSTIGRVVGRSI